MIILLRKTILIKICILKYYVYEFHFELLLFILFIHVFVYLISIERS